MRKFMTWLLILTKRQLKNPLLTALLVLVPLFAFIMNKIPSDNDSVDYEAGIYVDGQDELSLHLADELISKEGSITFTMYDDLDSLNRAVKNSSIICGYVLPDDLTQRTCDADCNDSILVIRQPAQTIQPAINELVYAELIKLQGVYIITDYVNQTGLFASTDSSVIDQLLDNYDYYTGSSETFHIDFKTYSSQGIADNNTPDSAVAFPVRGITSILIFLSALFGSVLWRRDNEQHIFDTLDKKYRIISRLLYTLIPSILFSISAAITLIWSGTYTLWYLEAAGLLVLTAASLVFCTVLTSITRNSRVLTACIPALLLGCLIFCPVFINVGQYMPAAKFIEKIFVPYYYLRIFM